MIRIPVVNQLKPWLQRTNCEIPGNIVVRIRKGGERRLFCVPLLAVRGAIWSRHLGWVGRQPGGITPANHKLCNVGVFREAIWALPVGLQIPTTVVNKVELCFSVAQWLMPRLSLQERSPGFEPSEHAVQRPYKSLLVRPIRRGVLRVYKKYPRPHPSKSHP